MNMQPTRQRRVSGGSGRKQGQLYFFLLVVMLLSQIACGFCDGTGFHLSPPLSKREY